MSAAVDPWTTLPDGWHETLKARLEPGETLIGWFEADLDQRLRYARQLLALTNRRLLAFDPDAQPTSWPLHADVTLKASEQGAVGTLELLGPERRLAHWRYTAGLVSSARGLLQRWDTARTGIPPSASVCPSCGGPIAPTEDRCPACSPVPERHSLSSLLRLVKFARPRAGMIALGFGLTLASTATSLVPVYLTIPLINEIFHPHQDGKPVDFRIAAWCLAGILGTTILYWLLDWARSYVSAWVSERISADLRSAPIRTFRASPSSSSAASGREISSPVSAATLTDSATSFPPSSLTLPRMSS